MICSVRLTLRAACLALTRPLAMGGCALLAAGALAAEAPSGSVPAATPSRPLLIRADQQSYDRQLGRLVASGHVELTVQGWRLRADRLEVSETSRTLLARGRVQLWRGDQYLQASSLRYSDWEGSAELLDVYGAIDRDTLKRDLNDNPAASASSGPAPAFACPPLESRPEQRPMLELPSLRRRPLPALAAPAGCPGAPDESAPPPSLRSALDSTALGVVPPGPPNASPPLPAVDSHAATPVSDVRFQRRLSTTIKLDLAAVIDPVESTSPNAGPNAGRIRTTPIPEGNLSRLRFQAGRLRLQEDRWTADAVAFTNDPFTPAAAWTLARQVSAVIDQTRGSTTIRARNSRIVLDGRLSLAAINNLTIGEEATQLVLDADKRDRDGIYLGYNAPPIRLGEKGSLLLQPQFMLQRALAGETGSYVRPGSSLASPRIEQPIATGDLLGLSALLNAPVGDLQIKADLNLSTLNPDNIASGTRSRATLTQPLGLAWAPSAAASLFGSYRERVYNGSLGLQTLIYSYGARLAGGSSLPLGPGRQRAATTSQVGFEPLALNWTMQSGQYQANLFGTESLATLWRSSVNLRASTLLRLWQASAVESSDPFQGLRYAAVPVVPGLAMEMGLSGTLASYSDGADQHTLTLWGGPALTLGRFEKPWLDYSRLSLSLGGTLRNGVSPFGFDRAVDLRTLSFNATQQIYGPLLITGGASFNIDPASEFYGDSSYSYVELKLQRRSYEIGVYYSPYDGIGGIRLTLNDFNFSGTGTPFAPRPAADQSSAKPIR